MHKLKAQSSKLKAQSNTRFLSLNVKFLDKEVYVFSFSSLVALSIIVTGVIWLQKNEEEAYFPPSLNTESLIASLSGGLGYSPTPTLTDAPDKLQLIECSRCIQSLDVQKNKSPTTDKGKDLVWEEAMIWQKNDNNAMTVDAYTIKFHIEHTTDDGELISYHDEWIEEIKPEADIYQQSARYRVAKDQWNTMEADINRQNAKIISDYSIKLERYRKSIEYLSIICQTNQ